MTDGRNTPLQWVPLRSDQLRRERRGLNLATVFAGVLVVLPGVGFVVAVMAFVDQPELFRLGAAIFCLAVGALFLVIARTAWTLARAGPPVAESAMLGVAADELTIVHPVVFRQAVTLPARLIRAVAIDTTGRRRDTFTWARFAVHVDGEPVGYLWSHRRESTLPVIGAAREVPSIAVIFNEPLGFGNVTDAGVSFDRAVSAVAPEGRRGGALPVAAGRRYDGLLLPVAEVEAARAALRTWPQLRDQLERQDVPLRVMLVPPPSQVAALVRPALVAYVAGVGLALLASAVDWYRGPLYAPLVLPLFVVAAIPTIASARLDARRREGMSRRRRVAVRVGALLLAGVSLTLLLLDFIDAAEPTRPQPSRRPTVPTVPTVPTPTTISIPGTTPRAAPAQGD
jgi:hypothetical protein